ncbi:MAG: hypothetical protein K9K79_02990, partial [Desulfohalobiaceae bacterium]|nr:hypothetical protein [Desulfohalobiaceae bacterium]
IYGFSHETRSGFPHVASQRKPENLSARGAQENPDARFEKRVPILKKLLSFSIDHTGKDGLQHDVSNCRPVNSYILINYVSALPEAKLTFNYRIFITIHMHAVTIKLKSSAARLIEIETSCILNNPALGREILRSQTHSE